ncbi:putative DNA-binding transcriptional regulator [Scandinavium sp. V105_16]|uniref:DNA-binding transcriptional regulator n=1 Tax=Scandinavium lactucae TaxID=3095028 RepID=A0AAJ2S6J1_9ENTR|nr:MULTISPECIES: YfeC-like transcriptional regulator [unclassified Scandinavium]MDX6019572.1 putative DNA-binding transcriptional regulator [Scandinavium sp. V105_16]MDX6030989.1 putative DNA-binding transcriptional regulator [Scandinavium sp. V105_12]MDX6039902.1 putative DNA-binding transcriptional regulator [Scandinavium sp. V105_6]MDX6051905.1 putative DNA-binding transcriptional regulator [Scandinavium sp. V105_1]
MKITLLRKMSTSELATLVGVTTQTVNRWIRKHHWATQKVMGVQGGRGRVIVITPVVRDTLASTRKLRKLTLRLQAEEPDPFYQAQENDPLLRMIQAILLTMTMTEKQRLLGLLEREDRSAVLMHVSMAEPSE